MNKPHHQNNISVMEDLVDGLVGMKDRRIDTIFHKRFHSPILHPYGRSFATTGSLGLQDLLSPASPLAHAAGNMPGVGVFSTLYHRYGWIFFIVSSNNDCVITIRILKGDDENE